MGYWLAGFDVVGVDHVAQPNYPFEFVQADALDMPWFWVGREFDAVHASPPCQAFTAYKRTGNVGDYPDLIGPVRELLNATGLPWVIENVEGAPLNDPTLVCGSMFDPAMTIRRHRLFETNWRLEPPMWPCRHKLQKGRLYPGGRSKEQTGTNRGLARATVEVGTWDTPIAVQQDAMGIDWMTLEELSEAIPPAYTELIGTQLLAHIQKEASVA